ncbi:uncharacterized protein JCM10292_000897 [Rhodotorula paludigena]|uniref:uncharacterized protein n=1 Tax=Rhodotorula paludigena TaxID=86838 RepID=UPI003170AEFA
MSSYACTIVAEKTAGSHQRESFQGTLKLCGEPFVEPVPVAKVAPYSPVVPTTSAAPPRSNTLASLFSRRASDSSVPSTMSSLGWRRSSAIALPPASAAVSDASSRPSTASSSSSAPNMSTRRPSLLKRLGTSLHPSSSSRSPPLSPTSISWPVTLPVRLSDLDQPIPSLMFDRTAAKEAELALEYADERSDRLGVMWGEALEKTGMRAQESRRRSVALQGGAGGGRRLSVAMLNGEAGWRRGSV